MFEFGEGVLDRIGTLFRGSEPRRLYTPEHVLDSKLPVWQRTRALLEMRADSPASIEAVRALDSDDVGGVFLKAVVLPFISEEGALSQAEVWRTEIEQSVRISLGGDSRVELFRSRQPVAFDRSPRLGSSVTESEKSGLEPALGYKHRCRRAVETIRSTDFRSSSDVSAEHMAELIEVVGGSGDLETSELIGLLEPSLQSLQPSVRKASLVAIGSRKDDVSFAYLFSQSGLVHAGGENEERREEYEAEVIRYGLSLCDFKQHPEIVDQVKTRLIQEQSGSTLWWAYVGVLARNNDSQAYRYLFSGFGVIENEIRRESVEHIAHLGMVAVEQILPLLSNNIGDRDSIIECLHFIVRQNPDIKPQVEDLFLEKYEDLLGNDTNTRFHSLAEGITRTTYLRVLSEAHTDRYVQRYIGYMDRDDNQRALGALARVLRDHMDNPQVFEKVMKAAINWPDDYGEGIVAIRDVLSQPDQRNKVILEAMRFVEQGIQDKDMAFKIPRLLVRLGDWYLHGEGDVRLVPLFLQCIETRLVKKQSGSVSKHLCEPAMAEEVYDVALNYLRYVRHPLVRQRLADSLEGIILNNSLDSSKTRSLHVLASFQQDDEGLMKQLYDVYQLGGDTVNWTVRSQILEKMEYWWERHREETASEFRSLVEAEVFYPMVKQVPEQKHEERLRSVEFILNNYNPESDSALHRLMGARLLYWHWGANRRQSEQGVSDWEARLITRVTERLGQDACVNFRPDPEVLKKAGA